jgi:hypothetical protein
MRVRGLVAAILAIVGWLATVPPGVAARAAPPQRVTLIAGGDVLLDRGVRARIAAVGDSSEPLRGLVPLLRGADIALANLECPLSDSGVSIRKQFMFRSGAAMAPFLRRAGFTVMSLANNHAYDCGREGLMETARNLRRAGIEPLGAGLNQVDALRPVLMGPTGMRIALLGFVDVPLEGLMPLADRPGPAQAETQAVLDAIRAAREKADRVVVTIHWGREYRPLPTERQRDLAARMVAAGADVVIGHHPHVIQPVERIGRGIVFYSVGNLIFDQTAPACAEGLLVRCRFGSPEDTVSAMPVRITGCRPERARGSQATDIARRLGGRSQGVTFIERSDGWWAAR